MSENQHNALDLQGRETKLGHVRPINPLYSGELGQVSGIGTSSPFRNAGSQGELWVFVTLFVILISTLIGVATGSFLVGLICSNNCSCNLYQYVADKALLFYKENR